MWEKVLEEIKNGTTQEPEPPENTMPDLSDITDIGDESPVKNVFAQSDSADNTFQQRDTSNSIDTSTETTHTRIYEYKATTIELDEMSMNIVDNGDSNGAIDSSTG